ncbi:MAG: hypothetical protein HYV17_08230 [Xanthomonadales bacterium]|nr:hypothetical protein [Xanthomonadales bacterium]
MNRPNRTLLLAAAMAIALALPAIAPRAEPFTFQGHLAQSGTPLDGTADLAFKLYNADTGGAQLGSTISTAGYPVVDGVFSVDLDFSGIAFDGSARWLQIEVNGTPLSGRIEILPAPLSASSNALRGRSVAATAPTAGQVLEWSGSSWTPTTPSAGTSYSAGTGLALAGSSFSVAPTFRLPQGCSNDQIARWNGSSWVCGADANTTYSAGNGLSLSGTVFSVNFAGSGAANTASRSDHDHFGQTWSGTSSEHGLYIFNSETTGSPTGIFGVEGAGTNTGAGVRGLSSNGTGVSGQGVTGVYGHTLDSSGKGVWGFGGASGVLGESAGVAGIGVHGRATHASGVVSGVRGETSSSLGNGVQGNNTSTSGGSGVYGLSVAALGRGVLGVNQATTGDAAGVYGQTASGAGYGVVGSNTGVTGSGAGVRGEGETGVEAQGTKDGLIASTTGGDEATAVMAVAMHPTAATYGVKVLVASPAAIGVQVVNNATSGNAYGVAAATGSSGGTAIYGLAPGGASGSPIGVRGETGAGGGYGLYGVNTATAAPAIALGAVSSADGGVAAEIRAQGAGNAKAIDALSSGTGGTAHALRARLTNAASSGDAIYAYANSTSAKAARFGNSSGTAVTLAGGTTALEATGDAIIAGNLGVFGTLSKGGGSFKIDHPLDPANQFLLHSFVESPDMMNVYNGNVITDARGYATIDLPDWFEALNRDFRYQLTVIGSFARAMVAEEVQGNRFAIRTETPNTKVSWQVTGIRKDRWAEKNRIPVEVQKAPVERGKYLHPELYGAPAGKRIGFEPAKDASRLAPTKSAAAPGKLP